MTKKMTFFTENKTACVTTLSKVDPCVTPNFKVDKYTISIIKLKILLAICDVIYYPLQYVERSTSITMLPI